MNRRFLIALIPILLAVSPRAAFSQDHALCFPGTVLEEADVQNGLRHASVALVFQLTALDHRYRSERLGNISTKILEEMWSAFDELAGRK